MRLPPGASAADFAKAAPSSSSRNARKKKAKEKENEDVAEVPEPKFSPPQRAEEDTAGGADEVEKKVRALRQGFLAQSFT